MNKDDSTNQYSEAFDNMFPLDLSFIDDLLESRKEGKENS